MHKGEKRSPVGQNLFFISQEISFHVSELGTVTEFGHLSLSSASMWSGEIISELQSAPAEC